MVNDTQNECMHMTGNIYNYQFSCFGINLGLYNHIKRNWCLQSTETVSMNNLIFFFVIYAQMKPFTFKI